MSRSGFRPEMLTAMSAELRHRGPDDEGFVTLGTDGAFVSFRGDDTVEALRDLPHWDSTQGRSPTIGMCHRRLTILDLSEAGHQPMISADANLTLVFNGEIYNYVELAAELESLGWRLRPCGDTAVLLAAFAQWGASCVERFRGMWAFAVYDRATDRLTLSRDRFGIKPLYYTRSGDTLLFASEIKALLAPRSGSVRGSTAEVVRLLTWGGQDYGARTLFDGVNAVPAGCNLEIDGRDLSMTTRRYYDVAQRGHEPFRGSLEDGVEEYRHRFAESLRLHMRSDVPVGTCLSGGLDSSLIASYAADCLRDTLLSTFTASYDDPAIDERPYIELQSRASGRFATHFTSPSAEGLVEDMAAFVRAQDLPTASTSPYAQWTVMRLAGENGVKVLLDGQGADEAIGGYSYFAGAYLLDLARRGRVLRALGEARRLREHRGVRVLPEVGRAAFRLLTPTAARHVRRHMRIGSRFVLPQHRSLAGEPSPSAGHTYRDYCVSSLQQSLPQLLRYEDRSSMAFSIESRVPFLDHPLVELVLSFPVELKYHQGWSKYVQRKAAEPRLPGEVVWRRDKLGFTTPQRLWHRDASAAMLEVVDDVDMPFFLDRSQIRQVISAPPSSATQLSEYWQLMFLLQWIRVFQVEFA